jgi:hypothetical protein
MCAAHGNLSTRHRMPSVPGTRKFGQLDSDFPPFADSGTYCESVFPMDRDATFDNGQVLPREQREAAGSCGFSAKIPSQAPSPPSWGLPSMVMGTSPEIGVQRYWSTLDSTLTGDGPRAGGWRQPAATPAAPAAPAAQGGGKRRRRTKRKSRKSRKPRTGKGKGKKVVKRRRTRKGAKKSKRGRGGRR